MGISMRLRLFLVLAMLAITIIITVFSILALTGTLAAGVKGIEDNMKKELTQSSSMISDQFDQIAAYTVVLSKDLSAGIEKELASKGLTVKNLKSQPNSIEGLIGNQYSQCLFSLQRAKCSGVFLILDATVNPSLENADNSKAGLFIKNMEPNILNSGCSYLFLLRGSPRIGRENSVTLHSQWRMEFDVNEASYYYAPIEAAQNGDLPVSKLYYWSTAMSLPGTNEKVMLCSAPLIDSKGKIFGVCGFEVSSLLFKLSNMPDTSTYPRLFCMLAPVTENLIYTNNVFTAGGFSTRDFAKGNQSLTIKKDQPFNLYSSSEDGTRFSGIHQNVTLYPEDSPFVNNQWIAAILMPDQDISSVIAKHNLKLLVLLLSLLLIGILLSYFISKHFTVPLSQDTRGEKPVLQGTEAYALIVQDPERLSADRFTEFVNNVKTLSPAERSVFSLYAEGYTAKEITEQLHLSINTIKTHSKHIYSKLNISSREELLLYVNTLKEAGREIKIN